MPAESRTFIQNLRDRIRSSLGHQVATFFSGLIVILTLLLIISSAIQQKKNGEAAVKREAHAMAQVAASSSSAAVLFHQRSDVADVLRAIEELQTFEFIVIRSFTENAFAFGEPTEKSDTLYTNGFDKAPEQTRRGRAQTYADDLSDASITNGTVIATVPVLDPSNNTDVIGEVSLGMSTRLMEASITRSRRVLLLVGLLAMVIFAAVTFFFVRRLARPLLSLRDASVMVSQGDLSRTLETDAINEIGTLTNSFNIMIERLREAREAQELLLKKSDSLLLNILPESIADRLKQGETTIADSIDDCTVVFADLVGFTELSARTDADKLVEMLNRIFSVFDHLADIHGLEKIKMIGDAYMAAGGIPKYQPDHAERVARFALDAIEAMDQFDHNLQIRIGINSGPVIAGVIGTRKFIYDLWGDTVNLASRMESRGVPGKVQITEATYERINHSFECDPRGTISVKGKGEIRTFFLRGHGVEERVAPNHGHKTSERR